MIEAPVAFNDFILNTQPRMSIASVSGTTITADDRHGLMLDTAVYFNGTNVPTGLTADTKYYVVARTDTTFDVSATVGGSAISVSGSGSYVNVAEVHTLLKQVDGLWDQDVRFESIDLPGRSGSRSGDSFYRGKTLVLTGEIQAANLWAMRNHARALQQAFDDMLPYPLYFALFTDESTKTDLYITCRKNQKIDISTSQPDRIGGGFAHRSAFVIQLFADDPNIYVVGTDAGFVVY